MRTLAYWMTVLVERARAQVFDGPGLEGGVGIAAQIDGPMKGTLRGVILDMLQKALGFLALAGVVMVVIAGYMFVVSAGNETAKDRAKKIIIYVVIGIVIILFARSLVGFFMRGLP